MSGVCFNWATYAHRNQFTPPSMISAFPNYILIEVAYVSLATKVMKTKNWAKRGPSDGQKPSRTNP